MSRQPVSTKHDSGRMVPPEQPASNPYMSRFPAAALEIDDLQRLIAIGPSHDDWQTELEVEAARLSGTSHAVAVASPNVALQCLLAAGNLQAGDEVIIPAYLPPSIPEVIRQFHAQPILVDIDAESAHLDIGQVAESLTDRTRAVIAVDIAGLPVETQLLAHICRRHRLLLIRDALTQTPGIGIRGETYENQARIYHCRAEETSLLSGGALICSSDENLASRLRNEIAPQDDLASETQQWDAKRSLHYADRMTELAAVWQLAAFGKARDAWRRRCQIAMSYTAAFSGRREFQVPYERSDVNHSWLNYPLRLNLQHLGISRDELTSVLRRRGVATTVPYLAMNLIPHYQERFGATAETFPVARNEFLRRVCLPIDPRMSDSEIDRVVDTIMSFADELTARRMTVGTQA